MGPCTCQETTLITQTDRYGEAAIAGAELEAVPNPSPRHAEIVADWNPRGNLKTVVRAEYHAPSER